MDNNNLLLFLFFSHSSCELVSGRMTFSDLLEQDLSMWAFMHSSELFLFLFRMHANTFGAVNVQYGKNLFCN